MTQQTQYKVIGTRPIRHDGVDKVTGRAKYGADVRLVPFGTLQRSEYKSKLVDRQEATWQRTP
jgi:CO/xanthine dehydrogenase Mo-binding subunit